MISARQTARMTVEDPLLWLEDVTGDAALEWVRARNAETLKGLTGGERFERIRTEIREVLDVDALAKAEGENWVQKRVQVLEPSYRRGLVELSRGGADAVVVREFDLEQRVFGKKGFILPE